MSVLVDKDILKLLENGKLVVTPLLDPAKQLGEASIDVRLGNEFINFRRPNLGEIDPSKRDKLQLEIEQYQEKQRIDYGKKFILHPRQFVLGATLEYIALPSNVAGQVVGRSSWGRLGLIIATATAVQPAFKGCITLELVNDGEVPIVLYPGMRIAQLVLYETSAKVEKYSGRYHYPTGPEFARVHRDRDIQIWANWSSK